MPNSLCLKWTYGRPGIDYRVASLFTRYLTDGRTHPKCRKTSFLKTMIIKYLKNQYVQNGYSYMDDYTDF